MSEIASIYKQLEKEPKLALMSFVICWPITYALLYAVWDNFASLDIFNRIVFSVVLEILILAIYIWLLSRIKKDIEKDNNVVSIGKVVGLTLYTEIIVIIAGLVFMKICTIQLGVFLTATIGTIVLLVLIFLEAYSANKKCARKQQHKEQNTATNKSSDE